MKAIFNWRYYVVSALLAIAIISVARAAGEPSEPISETQWFQQITFSLSIAALSIYALVRLVRKWTHDNKIPELTNPKIK